MHARIDNPELLEAQRKGIRIYSYPEYIYEQSKDKIRVVVGGSHGKTSITAMILHVLHFHNKDFDYMVGAQLEGFDTMVKLTAEAPCIILEGDEYLASPIDRRPKFHLYHPHIALISGIAWDHINVFPVFDMYLEQFKIFIDLIEKNGALIWCETDAHLRDLSSTSGSQVNKYQYGIPKHRIANGVSYLMPENGVEVPLQIFGDHNLSNAEGARLVCERLGLSAAQFYEAIQSFKGAAKRLELVAKDEQTAIYKDFAHSPSKLMATTAAVKKQYPDRRLVACMELHTFSSLNEQFLEEYKDSMLAADEAIVYYNPHTIAHKKLKPITEEQVLKAFGGNNLKVMTDSKVLAEALVQQDFNGANLLMMSSGTFDGISLTELADKILSK
jgi:UDP-N-acetylmuramate: L-alanyl-gamma-D-glutamyl-meso-diaminopimelate ligase